MDAFGSQLQKTLSTVVYLSVPVAARFLFFAEPIVDAVFQHGRFTDENSKAVAACLQYFAIGVAPWCMQPVLMRAYFAVQNTLTPILMGTVTTTAPLTVPIRASDAAAAVSLPKCLILTEPRPRFAELPRGATAFPISA